MRTHVSDNRERERGIDERERERDEVREGVKERERDGER